MILVVPDSDIEVSFICQRDDRTGLTVTVAVWCSLVEPVLMVIIALLKLFGDVPSFRPSGGKLEHCVQHFLCAWSWAQTQGSSFSSIQLFSLQDVLILQKR